MKNFKPKTQKPKPSQHGCGLHQHRFTDNPEELVFADAWAKQQDGNTLAWLLVGDQYPAMGLVYPSDRDRVVAATVVQWLGSPVGQYFLEQLGYVKNGKRPRTRQSH